MVKILNFYIEKFKKLNRSVTPQGIAPHEPVLLLAVISAIAEGAIVENAFSKQLLKPFFDKIWQALVTNHKYNFDLPFTALQSEGFWHRNKSKNELGFVFLDDELYDYLQIKKGRNILIRTLLESYFWDTKTHWQKIYPALFEAKTADSQVYKEKNCMVNSIKTMVDADMLEVSILPISSQCLNALKEANVNSVADFCVFDLNVLIGAQWVGKRKIRILYDLQQEQRKIHGISKSLPPLDFVGLHGNLWVNQCEIHQNPPSVKRQSGITAPLRVAFIPFVV